jgi:predicted nucleic acid-binding Zn ribbon protein
MRDYNTSKIGEAIKEMLKSYRLEKKVTETELYQSWEALMGPSIYKHTQSIQLRDKVLVIRLDSSALRHELGFAKDKIVEKINEHVGYKFVDDVLLM